MKIFKMLSLIALSLLLYSCGNNLKENFDHGMLFKKWSYSDIKVYNSDDEGSAQAVAFIKRIEVSPMELDFTNAKNGTFQAFFPDMDDELLISRDFFGKVNFSVKESRIHASFNDVQNNTGSDLKSINIIELTEDKMVFELNGNGILYHVSMKAD